MASIRIPTATTACPSGRFPRAPRDHVVAVDDLEVHPVDEQARAPQLPDRSLAGKPVEDVGGGHGQEHDAGLDREVRRAGVPEVVARVDRGRHAVGPQPQRDQGRAEHGHSGEQTRASRPRQDASSTPAAAPRAAKPAHGKGGKNDPGWRPSMYPARPGGQPARQRRVPGEGREGGDGHRDRERGRDPRRAPRPGEGDHPDDQERRSDAVEDVDPQQVPRRAEAAGGEHPEPEEERVAEDLQAPRETRAAAPRAAARRGDVSPPPPAPGRAPEMKRKTAPGKPPMSRIHWKNGRAWSSGRTQPYRPWVAIISTTHRPRPQSR